MRIFIDTSTLLKKYIQEEDVDVFEGLLERSAEIVVSPVTWIEMNRAISGKLSERKVTADDAARFRFDVKRDFMYYFKALWNEALEEKALELVCKNNLKTLDAIQLASGVLSDAEFFLTSDEKLFKEAKKVLPRVMLV